MNDNKNSASFVFADFVNLTGFNAPYTAILGLLQAAFGMWYVPPFHPAPPLNNRLPKLISTSPLNTAVMIQPLA